MIVTEDALKTLAELLLIGVSNKADISVCVKDGILIYQNDRTRVGLSVYVYPEHIKVNILKGGNVSFVEDMPYHNGTAVSALNIYTFDGLLANVITDNAIFIVKDIQLNGLQLAVAIRTHSSEFMQSLGITFSDLKL